MSSSTRFAHVCTAANSFLQKNRFMEDTPIGDGKVSHAHDAIISDFNEEVKAILCKYLDGTIPAKGESACILFCLAPAPKENA